MLQFAVLSVLLLPFASAGLAGGKTPIDLKADDVNVVFAVGKINEMYAQKGDNAVRTLVTVEKATSQVVAGVLYDLTLNVQSGSAVETCTVSVWSRPWLSGDEAMQVSSGPTCTPKLTISLRGGALGAPTAIDFTDSEVQLALQFGVQTLNNMENSLYLRRANTDSATVSKQVVSGYMYHFKNVRMEQTDCIKGSSTDLTGCSSSTNVLTCDFDIWYQSWMTPQYKLLNEKCQ